MRGIITPGAVSRAEINAVVSLMVLRDSYFTGVSTPGVLHLYRRRADREWKT